MGNLQYQDSTAWMVRRDGSIFPVVQHIYGNPLEMEETLFAAEWLYEHTDCEKTRKDIEALVHRWIIQFSEERDGWEDREKVRQKIYRFIEKRPYRVITRRFVDKLMDQMRNNESLDKGMDMEKYSNQVIMDLNEEFMRVRFGGIYHTKSGNRKLYFRISSENYNWSTVIMRFIERSQLDYEEFYVVIDEESAEINPNILKQSRLLNAVSGLQL